MRRSLAGILLFLSACGENSDAPGNKDSVAISAPVEKAGCDSCPQNAAKKNSYTWFADYTDCKQMSMLRGDLIDSVKTIDDAIGRLNTGEKVKIEKVKTIGDTLYVRLVNGEWYTQRMGTTGATYYMYSVVFTLTDHFGYNVVHVDFEEGDHGGQPGFRDRKFRSTSEPLSICR
jgi:hypothetical protein